MNALAPPFSPIVCAVLLLAACDGDAPAPAPPLPPAPVAPPPAPAAPPPAQGATPVAPAQPSPERTVVENSEAPARAPRDRTRADAPEARSATTQPSPAAAPHAAAPHEAIPEPARVAPAPPAPPAPPAQPVPSAPPAAPNKKVTVPATAHVRVDVPRGLQSLLDADPRMQPWVDKVIAVIDRCYGSERVRSAEAAGVVEIAITMHLNARPDADVKSVPPQLGGVVACATPELMRARPPLFTGPEEERHTLRIRFTQ